MNTDILIKSPHLRSSFEELVRLSPELAWAHQYAVAKVLIFYSATELSIAALNGIKPASQKEESEKSPEEVMKSYAAIRGEVITTSNPDSRENESVLLQIRLDMLGLLEGNRIIIFI
jgi:hypothetical protein